MKWLAVVPLLLVGCASPVPVWEAGMEWHYVTDNGHWQNWTVTGTDAVRGYDTFTLTITDSNPTAFSFTQSWVHQETLGGLAYTAGELKSEWDCPATQLLPLEPKAYTCTGGPAGNARIVAHSSFPNGTVMVETPLGPVEATKIELTTNSRDVQGGEPTRNHATLYYSAEHRNYAQYEGLDCSTGQCRQVTYRLAWVA